MYGSFDPFLSEVLHRYRDGVGIQEQCLSIPLNLPERGVIEYGVTSTAEEKEVSTRLLCFVMVAIQFTE